MSHRGKIVYSGNSSRSKRLHEKVESTKKVAELQSKDVPKKKIKSSYVRWSEAEDMRLKYLQKVHGNCWDEIVKFFPGYVWFSFFLNVRAILFNDCFFDTYRRTAKSIKIRYYGTLSRDPKPSTSLNMGSRHFVPGYVFFSISLIFFSPRSWGTQTTLFYTYTQITTTCDVTLSTYSWIYT